jgi:uncharacterized protein
MCAAPAVDEHLRELLVMANEGALGAFGKRELVARAEDTRDALAQLMVGVFYMKGIAVQRDAVTAVRFLRAAADQDIPEAHATLADCYVQGFGLVKDDREAFRFYLMAADQGRADAQFNVGAFLVGGRGVAKDEFEGARYLRMAANQGHTEAQFWLGRCLRSGVGVDKDEVAASRYLRMAADEGNAEAQVYLALWLEKRTVVAGNKREALRYFRLAADEGHAEAQYHAGLRLFENGVDEREAAQYFRMAADQGHSGGQKLLACCMQTGVGVEKDAVEAERLFQLAAFQGTVQTQVDLEEYHGDGARMNLAAKYYCMAAEQGNYVAQRLLAVSLRDGTGVEQDRDEAGQFLLRALKQLRPDSDVDDRALDRQYRQCCVCGKRGVEHDGVKLCAGCKTAAYCSSEHQHVHWKMHKPVCHLLCKPEWKEETATMRLELLVFFSDEGGSTMLESEIDPSLPS